MSSTTKMACARPRRRRRAGQRGVRDRQPGRRRVRRRGTSARPRRRRRADVAAGPRPRRRGGPGGEPRPRRPRDEARRLRGEAARPRSRTSGPSGRTATSTSPTSRRSSTLDEAKVSAALEKVKPARAERRRPAELVDELAKDLGVARRRCARRSRRSARRPKGARRARRDARQALPRSSASRPAGRERSRRRGPGASTAAARRPGGPIGDELAKELGVSADTLAEGVRDAARAEAGRVRQGSSPRNSASPQTRLRKP